MPADGFTYQNHREEIEASRLLYREVEARRLAAETERKDLVTTLAVLGRYAHDRNAVTGRKQLPAPMPSICDLWLRARRARFELFALRAGDLARRIQDQINRLERCDVLDDEKPITRSHDLWCDVERMPEWRAVDAEAARIMEDRRFYTGAL